MNPAGCGAAGRPDGSGPLGMLGTGSVIRKCIERMQNLTYVVARWPCSPCTRAWPLLQSTPRQPPAHAGGCKGHLRFFCQSRDLRCTPGHESLPVAPTQDLHVHRQRLCSTHTAPPRTHAHTPRSCSRRPGRRRVGPTTGLPLFSSCLLPPAGSSGHRERARASLLPHLQHTCMGQARCTPRALVQTLKVA